MREILFRGKRVDNGEWIYGGYAKCNNREYILPDIDLIGKEWVFKNIEVIPESVSQFTGFTDINGKKVFEGDIVRDVSCYLTHLLYVKQGIETLQQAEENKKWGKIGVVKFCLDEVGSCGCCYQSFVGSGFKANEIDISKCEIIGNITDNPELLKVQDER